MMMPGTQIQGGPGKVDNVEGSKSDSPSTPNSFETGVNTQVANQQMAINRTMYERDKGTEVRYLIKPEGTSTGTTPDLARGNTQITK
jgi:hypothetical protein